VARVAPSVCSFEERPRAHEHLVIRSQRTVQHLCLQGPAEASVFEFGELNGRGITRWIDSQEARRVRALVGQKNNKKIREKQ